MKQITDFINEGFRINKNTKIRKANFTVDELRNDYKNVGYTYSKTEKEPFMIKYGVDKNSIRDIKLVILNHLKDLRQSKKEFTNDDIMDFIRFRYDTYNYNKFKTYLDEEPKEFIEYMLSFYEKQAKRIPNTNHLSIADKDLLKKIKNLKRYLDEI